MGSVVEQRPSDTGTALPKNGDTDNQGDEQAIGALAFVGQGIEYTRDINIIFPHGGAVYKQNIKVRGERSKEKLWGSIGYME